VSVFDQYMTGPSLKAFGAAAVRLQPLDKIDGESHFIRRVWGSSMPLTRGQPLGYDNERMVFKFTMLNGDEAVECQISGAAMDDVAGGKGTLPADREAQFLRFRERIEHIASTISDEKTVLKGAVLRIFSKHIGK
jgi:hypothetical protein